MTSNIIHYYCAEHWSEKLWNVYLYSIIISCYYHNNPIPSLIGQRSLVKLGYWIYVWLKRLDKCILEEYVWNKSGFISCRIHKDQFISKVSWELSIWNFKVDFYIRVCGGNLHFTRLRGNFYILYVKQIS